MKSADDTKFGRVLFSLLMTMDQAAQLDTSISKREGGSGES